MEDTTRSANGPVRVRLAPSPTGYLHIGTRLRGHDRPRPGPPAGRRSSSCASRTPTRSASSPRRRRPSTTACAGWACEWDEGPDVGGPYAPYRQSERLPLYQEVGAELLASGKAYRCWCSPERLEEMRREQQARKQPPQLRPPLPGQDRGGAQGPGGHHRPPGAAPADAKRRADRLPGRHPGHGQLRERPDPGHRCCSSRTASPPTTWRRSRGRPRDGHHPRLPGRGVAPQRAHSPAALRRPGLAHAGLRPHPPAAQHRPHQDLQAQARLGQGLLVPGAGLPPPGGAELPGQPGRPGPGPGAPGRPQRAARAVRLRGDRRATWTSSASAPRAS